MRLHRCPHRGVRRVHRRGPLHAGRGPGRGLLRHRPRHVAGGVRRRRVGHVVGDPVPPPVARHRHDRRSTSSCSEASSERCSPACSPTRFGRRGALTLIVLPSTLIGGALIAYGARYIRGDISRCVEELLEEKDEADRVRQGGGRHAGRAGPQPRLLLRLGAGAVRRQPRRGRGRDGGAARHQRRRQVDAPARHQRARRRQPRRRAAPRPHHHLRRSGAARQGRRRAAHGRQRHLLLAVGGGEPADGGVPLRRRRAARSGRGRAGPLPRARRVPSGRGPATCPAGSSRCSRWRWRCCTSPTC